MINMRNYIFMPTTVGTPKEKKTMRKIRKLLAVFLAAIMLATFMPLFASAATITLNANNVIILEAPKISYGDQIDVNVITANYGVTANDLTVTGGKLGYIASEGAEPVVIPGTFSGSSTLKFSVGENSAIRLKFTPDDTTTYSSPQISPSYPMAEGVVWPSANVIGQAVTVAEYPSIAATTIGCGTVLASAAKISGGKVVDADGNEVSGSWSYVNNRVMDTEGTFEEEYQWKKSGYATIILKVTITVTAFKTTLVEAPTMTGIEIGGRTNQKIANSTITGGKVVDESGAEITGGKWSITGYPEGLTSSSYIFADTTVTLTWSKTGYESVTSQAVIPVTQVHETYTFEAFPSLELSGQSLSYSPDRTWESLKINPGIIKDKNGNIVEGTYELYFDKTGIIKLTGAIVPSTSASEVYIFFVPNDATLPTFGGIYDNIRVSKINFTLTEDSELVLNYGTGHKKPFYGSDFKFSTFKTIPEDAGVDRIVWEKDVFDPATADYGSVTMVSVTVYPEKDNCYNTITLEIPIRIQKFTYTNESWCGTKSNLVFSGTKEQEYDGIKEYKIDFTNKRLKGTVDLIINDEVIASASPDENGRFYVEGQWNIPASGEYTYRFEYKPSDEDSAIVNQPVAKEGTVTLEIRPMRTLTVKVGDAVYTLNDRVGNTVYFNWKQETDLSTEEFTSWVFTDAQGNKVTLVNPDGENITNTPSLYFFMPDYDVTATMKNQSSIGDDISGGGDAGDGTDDDANNGIFGGIWSFFQKLINWFINIIKQMMSLFGLGA